jgi:formamidase
MTGLGGLNKSPNGVVVGLVQLQLPVVDTPGAAGRAGRAHLRDGRQGAAQPGTMDLVVFPEYALHGLSMSTAPELMVHAGRARGRGLQGRLRRAPHLGLLLDHGANPHGNPYNTGLVIDDQGAVPPVLPQAAPLGAGGALGAGQHGRAGVRRARGSKLALIICHDGMFPEMAREAAYKGAEIILRTAGYTAPIRHAWKITNQANAFQNLAQTASVCLCGSDGSFDSMGEACSATSTARCWRRRRPPDEIITAELRPDLVREARAVWGVENNPYQLYHRGYVAVQGGAQDCPYTFMQDMVPAATGCPGTPASRSRTARPAASPPDAQPTAARN